MLKYLFTIGSYGSSGVRKCHLCPSIFVCPFDSNLLLWILELCSVYKSSHFWHLQATLSAYSWALNTLKAHMDLAYFLSIPWSQKYFVLFYRLSSHFYRRSNLMCWVSDSLSQSLRDALWAKSPAVTQWTTICSMTCPSSPGAVDCVTGATLWPPRTSARSLLLLLLLSSLLLLLRGSRAARGTLPCSMTRTYLRASPTRASGLGLWWVRYFNRKWRSFKVTQNTFDKMWRRLSDDLGV